MFVATPPSLADLLDRLDSTKAFGVMTDGGDGRGEYPHWDRLRRLEPPEGLSHEEWWLGIKLARLAAGRPLPLHDAIGRPFVFTLPDSVLRRLHYVDQRCSGEIAMAEVVTADAQARQHYLVNSLMEEAIRSSQLEGATTSRRVAKELLRSGREPKTRSERMIVNNYVAMQFMRDEIGDRLTPESVLELQRILTDGTLDDPGAAGRMQRPDEERVAVLDNVNASVLHVPPPAEQLPARLQAMCDFANEEPDGERFVHPVVRAILLHFWLAYDHPFEDGNGRTARALFYWYMRTRGYWLVEYLSISKILREAQGRYSRSFLLTETDEGDTTYFLLYQLQVIERAVDELHRYLRRKMAEVRAVERLIKGTPAFNHRQMALLSDALRNPERSYTFAGHAAIHQVTHETARSDLSDLASKGLLDRRRISRQHVFEPRPDLSERLNAVPPTA